MDMWINQMWFSHTMGYFSGWKRKNRILTHVNSRDEPWKCGGQTNRPVSKDRHCLISLNEVSGLVRLLDAERRPEVARREAVGKEEWVFYGGQSFSLGRGNFWRWMEGMVTQPWKRA